MRDAPPAPAPTPLETPTPLEAPTLGEAPSLWETMAADPAVAVDPAALALVIADQRSRSRALLYPWIRPLSRLLVAVIVIARRLCPWQGSAHGLMDRMCLWFCRRLVSPVAVTLLIRHFIIESNMLAFIARNAPGGPLPEPSLRPAAIAGLGDGAVIEHDMNVYRVLHAIGSARAPGGGVGGAAEAAAAPPDYGMIAVPVIDPGPASGRLLNLDIQTALCLMAIPFAACLTPGEYRRAVHSMRLDASLLALLAQVTGDEAFLGWRTTLPPVRVDSAGELPVMVYEHAVACELAHARLAALRDARAGLAPPARPPVAPAAGALASWRR
jgi:hypothetical protein